MKKIIFNSSMPRSGSTLLQNILGNNPTIHATPTNGVFEMLVASKKIYSKSPVFKAQDSDDMKKAFLTYCRYGLEGFFDALTDRPYVIDKSRSWAVNKPFIDSFYPNAKVICMVRDLRDIVTSMEKNYRKHPDKHSLGEENEGLILGQRVSIWMSPQAKPVGHTLNNLKEVIHRGFNKDMLFVKFEDLTRSPKEVMQKIHNYLEIPYYNYDFNNIKQVTFEDDKFHGIYGDHIIKPKVKEVKSVAKQILGNRICNLLYERNKWYFDYFEYEK